MKNLADSFVCASRPILPTTIMVLQPAIQENLSIQSFICSIGLTILLGIFLQTAIVFVLCHKCSLFKLFWMYMANTRPLWSIANTTTTEVNA